MDASPAKLLVLVGKKFACVKIIGRANFACSIDFRTLVMELKAKNFSCFVMDLSECALMDSTFLGVLAGFGLKMNEADDDSPAGRVTLLNPNSRIMELLESLGVLDFFKITHGELAPPENLQPTTSQPANASREELTCACLEAHETLMAVNPANVARFKDVTKFLAEDLKKLRE
jgi:anti-sigma B factor antagonist